MSFIQHSPFFLIIPYHCKEGNEDSADETTPKAIAEIPKTTFRISEITLQITELENEIATAKKKCDEATEKEMEVNEVTALQDFDKIQLSKIIEKVFIYGPGRMEINWKMDDIFYKEEKA